MQLGTGWLTKGNRTDSRVGHPETGILIDKDKFPTRHAEYNFVLDVLANEFPRPGFIVDAASGFNPEIHLLANALNNAGWTVLATDANPAALQMPGGQRLTRVLEDITFGWFTRGLEADAWTCVSTLEELPPLGQLMVVETAFATLRPGGLAIVTADALAPARLAGVLRYAGFEVGPVAPLAGEPLCPRVAYAVARKLGGA